MSNKKPKTIPNCQTCKWFKMLRSADLYMNPICTSMGFKLADEVHYTRTCKKLYEEKD